MGVQSLIRIAVMVLALPCAQILPCAQTPARAQGAPAGRAVRYRPPHIVVTPRLFRDYHRQCTDWLALERRPSGTVVVPRFRCWWVGQ